jgi:hypothetical protein
LLLVPFLFARRLRAVAIGAGLFALLAAFPMLWQPSVWTRYLDDGVRAISLNAARSDNGSIIELFHRVGTPTLVALAVLGAVTAIIAVYTHDLFWPAAWLIVASLPIAWMYSLITLLPLALWIVLRAGVASRSLIVVASGLMLAAPPLGRWAATVFPLVVGLCYVAMFGLPASARDDFWVPAPLDGLIRRFAPKALVKR